MRSSSLARPPRCCRALIAKQRARQIARTAERNSDTLDNLIKRHHDDRAIIFTANDFAYDISQRIHRPLHHARPRLTNALGFWNGSGRGYSMLMTSRCLTGDRRACGERQDHPLGGASSPDAETLGRILRPRMIANRHASTKSSRTRRGTYVSRKRRRGGGRCVVLTANLARVDRRRSQTVVHRSD